MSRVHDLAHQAVFRRDPAAQTALCAEAASWCSLKHYGYNPHHDPTASDTNMTKLTLQEQMLKAGLVTSKKMAKVQRTAKKSRVQAREAREAVEENKRRSLNAISS